MNKLFGAHIGIMITSQSFMNVCHASCFRSLFSSNNSHITGQAALAKRVKCFEAARSAAIADSYRSHFFFHRLNPYTAGPPYKLKIFPKYITTGLDWPTFTFIDHISQTRSSELQRQRCELSFRFYGNLASVPKRQLEEYFQLPLSRL